MDPIRKKLSKNPKTKKHSSPPTTTTHSPPSPTTSIPQKHKKRRPHIVLDDIHLMQTRAGLRTLIRKIGRKYGNTRVSMKAIKLFQEIRTVDMRPSELLKAIEIASKSASVNGRKTCLPIDMELGMFSSSLHSYTHNP